MVPDAAEGKTDGIDRTTCAPLTGKTDKTGSNISQCLGRDGTVPERRRTAYAYND